MLDVIVIGGGAAGFYGAVHIAKARPNWKIILLEKGKQFLSKVRISGGGRCNVTHAEFDPSELVKNYPRGNKELLGPFYTHAARETVDFFQSNGIRLKTEADGRMFPVTDSSQTIIDFLLSEAKKYGVRVLKQSAVKSILPIPGVPKSKEDIWEVQSVKKNYQTRRLLLTTGSNPSMWAVLARLGHTIIAPVPSLFTFNIKDDRIKGIQGVSTNARVEILGKKLPGKEITVRLRSERGNAGQLSAQGPLLITHWGMSGPAILKLSAWGAHLLNDYGYRFRIRVNWLPEYHCNGLLSLFMEVKEVEPKKTVLRTSVVDLPRRLWINLAKAAGITEKLRWADTSKKSLENLAKEITESEFLVEGKSTFKEEFVTAGGVDLKEINFKTFESKIHPNLYFAGEVINVDAITGGFNFQNAWTGAYIAAKAMTNR